jgi:regulator of sigma E protease
MTLLAIDWASIAVKTGQFILSFSILVVLHELGHFLPAKWFKCRVEKFYLFFNPWFSLWKKQKGETEYGIGWVPFGGYVKISGMVDESMDKEQMKLPPQDYEFRSKPAWQRLIIMVGGVVVNIILALVLFVMIMWVWGEEYLPVKNMKYGIYADSLAVKAGLQNGDYITKLDDKVVKNALTVPVEIVLDEVKTMTVERNGQTLVLPVPEDLANNLNKNKLGGFTSIRVPFIVSAFTKESTAEKAGLKKDDVLIGVDSVATPYFQEIAKVVNAKAGQSVAVKFLRGADTMSLNIPVSKEGFIGARPVLELDKLGFALETQSYSFLESIPVGIKKCWETLGRYVTGLKQLVTGKVNPNDSLGSVISIGNTFPGEWDWQQFWRLTAIFSIILAFMNILPIPALDGGHALFTLVEMITGRKPSDKFMEYAQMVGMVLLLGLMAYALGLDFWRMFK